MRGGGGRFFGDGGKAIDERRGIDVDAAVGDPEHAHNGGPRQSERLLGLNQTRLGRGALGVGARGFGARPELVVDQHVHRTPQHVAAIDVGASRGDRALRRKQTEKGRSHCCLHVEPGERFARLRPRHRRLGAADGRIAKAEVERLPRQQRAGRAAPHALNGRGGQHRTRHRGNHRLRQHLAENVVRRRAVGLPH